MTSGEQIRVLHVDDEPEFADMAAEHLRREDESITVQTATSVEDGIAVLGEANVDCVVSDYDMPGRNGIEFLEAVRQEDGDLPFILFTGKGSEEIASDAISAGVTDYLEKERGTDQYTILANRIRNAVERYRAQRAAESTERRINRMYERITDGFFAVDTDWRYTYVNEEGARIVGMEKEDLIGQVVWDIFPNMVDSPFENALRMAMEFRKTTSVEEYYPAHDAWYDVRVYPDVDGISIYFQEVSERKQHERELVDERDRYSTLFENLPNPVVHGVLNGDEVVVKDVNPAFEEQFGYDPATFEGQSLHDVILPGIESLDRDVESLNQKLVTEGQLQAEVRRDTVDGERDFLVNIMLDQPESTHPEGYAIYTDITDRKQREAELERYETLVETVAGGVFAQDAEGKYSYINSYIEEKTGYDREEVVGRDPAEFIPEKDIEEINREIGEMLEGTREMVSIETEMTAADGDSIPIEGRLTLLPSDDGFRGTVGVVQDITGRKKRERELRRQKERLEEFTRVVSHDLRNPLNVAQGQLELAMEEHSSEHLEKIKHSHDRMWRLIEDLLTLAREGEQATDTEPLFLGDSIEAAWQNVETADVSLRTDVSAQIHAERSRLQQLLENLIRNAVEHGGESITVEVGELQDGFYVADDGPGIPPDQSDEVFEAGYSTADEGTGFGLSIVRQVVEAHDWEVSLTESDGGGARFEIRGVELAE